MKKEYIPRLFDETLDFALRSKGAVLVVGPKWCGKTRTASRHAKTIIEMLPSETREQYINFAKTAPSLFLKQGKKPILIDEWQFISFIWNSIKVEVDKSDDFGQFILTGSVTDKTSYSEIKNEERHSGNGRIVSKMMRTLSLFESKESNGTVSLSALQKGNFKPSISDKTIEDYAFYICRGGWPLAINVDRKVALAQARDYYDTLYKDDIFSLRDLNLRIDYEKSSRLIKSYARNIGTQCGDATLLKDLEVKTFDRLTLNKYLEALSRLFVIDELPARNTNLRSKTAIRSNNTRYFVDPSIATAALGLSPESLFFDMKLFGFLFESLAIRDLKIYCDSIGANLYHYRDSLGREADAVVVYENGEFGLIEVKLGADDYIENAAKNLLKLQEDLIQKPIYMMVITQTKFAYKREDGVYVAPLATLRN